MRLFAKGIIAALLSFIAVFWWRFPEATLSSPESVPRAFTPRARELPGPTVMAEHLSVPRAVEFLRDTKADIGQRNEAMNVVRELKPEQCLQLIAGIIEDDREDDLFKSWAIQHVGVMAIDGTIADRRKWIGALRDQVHSNPHSAPIWRESLFALAGFIEDENLKWIRAYTATLPAAIVDENRQIIDEARAGRRKMTPYEIISPAGHDREF